MKSQVNFNRRKFISRTAATGLGLAFIPSLGLGGCSETTSKTKIPQGQNPKNFGLVTFFELDGNWPQKPENLPWTGGIPGLDIDTQGNVWLIVRALPIVQEYNADGKFLKSFGTKGPAVASVAGGPVDLTFPMDNPNIHQIKVDHEGNVWIATWGMGVVYKCSPEGKVLMVLGTLNESGTDEKHFGDPNDMVITPTGEIFVADGEYNTRVVHFDPQGKFIKAWGKSGSGPGEFANVHSIGIDSKGLIYVGDRANTRIQVFDQSGNFIDQWPDIIVPFDIWVDGEDNLWAAGYGPLRTKAEGKDPRTGENIIVKFNSQGKVLLNWTFTTGVLPGEMGEVHGVAVDSKGNVFTSEVGPSTRVTKFVLQS